MVFNKKAISPVVATALLLVVAVVAVVGFQTWFTGYNSATLAKVDSQSNSGASLTIERLEVGGSIYIKNAGTATQNVTLWSGSTNCWLSAAAPATTTSGANVASGLQQLYYNSSTQCDFSTVSSVELLLKTSDSLQEYTAIVN